MKKCACLLLLILLSFGTGIFLARYRQWQQRQQDMARVYEPVYQTIENEPTPSAPGSTPAPPSPGQIQQVSNHYDSVIGWLEIPGVLRYPVVQSSDNTFFLTHDFQGHVSACGSIFMDFQNDISPLDQNTVLYGHTMGRASKLMFSQLTRYKSPSFLRSHPTLTFDTAHQSYGTWTIFAVCHLPANQASSFLAKEFVSRAAFTSFVREIQQNALYDTGIQAPENSRLLTLVTCDRSRYGKDGRLLVFAFCFSEL